DAHDLGLVVDENEQLVRAPHVLRRDPHVAVRDDVIVAEPVVDDGLEDLDLLARDLGAAEAADELLALAAEHAAGHDLDPALARRLPRDVHTRPDLTPAPGIRRFRC